MVIKLIKKADVPPPAPAPEKKRLIIVKKPVVTQRNTEAQHDETPEPVAFNPTSTRYYPEKIECSAFREHPLDDIYLAAQRSGCSYGHTLSWWLMASYAYYILDKNLLTDQLYDQMAKDLKKHWDEIDHPHKKFVKPEHLNAGSLFDLPRIMYPSTTVGGLTALLKGEWGATW